MTTDDLPDPDPATITACLWDAALVTDQGGRFLEGEVYADLHQRWPNASMIATDYVVDEIAYDTYRTRSGCVFHVCSWRPAITAF